MKKVLTFGVFDLFHFGHLKLLKSMSKLGDYCIVAVQTDEYVVKFKPIGTTGTFYSTEERIEMIRALRCIDEVIEYNIVDENIKKIDFDIWVKGPDQIHSGFQAAVKWCEDKGKEIITLPRTEGISTTHIKRLIKGLTKNEEEHIK